MKDLAERAHARNKQSTSRCVTTQDWSAEFPINQRELVRAELSLSKAHVTLDLRRRFKTTNGARQSTGRGVALSARHIASLAALVDAAAAQVQTTGMADAGDR
jgi:hypothetical protein